MGYLMAKDEISILLWKERMRDHFQQRRMMKIQLESLAIPELIDFIKSLDTRDLKTAVNCGIKGWRYWIAEHELCHRMLSILLPKYEIVEKARQENKQ
ncbi:hypothetical protein [Candidatus Methanodesulfokora washburnensis]|uniref:Uncharacterized protein n=1 Tax=Candidatus Methanodesulfokora washburnensis TaxID=2478471 RepID=A0A429GWX2_9CREN|nr:hypothetical protein [Candidatus Methanodesulfokores washburnensis]RSN78413.1 hypothetical protein D6D85_00900 [Candidatus Methanodesulfokores washburnensis]